MNAPNDANPEPKSPFADGPRQPRIFERRAWVVLVLTVVCLLIGLATPNAIFAHRIQRIVDNGGYVRSRADYFGSAQSRYLGHWLSNFYADHYVIRDDYEVFLGDTDRAIEVCGGGISLAEAPDDDVHRDPGDEGPKMARELGRIIRLSLAETSVTDHGLAPLAGMTSIRTLDLSATQVIGPGLANLRGMDLLSLSLNGNSIDDEGFAFLPDFPNLNQLDIGKTRALSAFVARIDSFPKVTDLNLEGLPVTDEIVEKLTKLPLWRLNLSNTPITEASVPHLEKMTNLQDLNLCRTKMLPSKTLESNHPAIKRWVQVRELVFLPGQCEGH